MQDTGLLLRDDPIDGLGPSPEVATQAFQLADNAVSPALRVARGWVFVTRDGRSRTPTSRSSTKWGQGARRRRTRRRGRNGQGQGRRDCGVAEERDRLRRRREEGRPRGQDHGADRARGGDSGHRHQRRGRQSRVRAAQGGVSDAIATPKGTAIVRVVEKEAVTDAEIEDRARHARDRAGATRAAIGSSAPTWRRRRRG